MLIATALLIAFFFLGSVCLKHVRDFSPLRTGLVFLPVAVATGIGAHLGARFVGRIGSRPTAVAGMAVAAAGSVPPTRLSESGSVDAGLLPDFVIASLGIGAVFVTATTTALAMVEHREAGLASGVVNTFHEVGGSIDVAVVSTVAASGLERGSAGGFAGAFNSIPEVRGAVGDPRCPSPKGACSGGQGGAPARMPGMTTAQNLAPRRSTRSVPVVVGVGVAIGVLGGMIGLGGAEFRLPLLVGLFGFAALSAVILNKAMSLVVVLVALPARLAVVPATEVVARWPVAVNLLADSLLGAWAGATWAVRMRSATLHKVLAALMLLMAAALMVTHTTTLGTLALPLWAQVPCGVVAGFGVGVVAAIMGVARRRAADPDDRAVVRSGHQNSGKPLPAGVPADNARGLRPVQPRRQFRGDRREPPLHSGHGNGFRCRRADGRAAPGRLPGLGAHPRADGDPARLRSQARPSPLTLPGRIEDPCVRGPGHVRIRAVAVKSQLT
ncbi:TSUP family transporter [Streptomyces coeruleorubidus]